MAVMLLGSRKFKLACEARTRVRRGAVRGALEPLERRVLLSAISLYVSDNWRIELATETPGLWAWDAMDKRGRAGGASGHDLPLGSSSLNSLALPAGALGDGARMMSGKQGEARSVTQGVSRNGGEPYGAARGQSADYTSLPTAAQSTANAAVVRQIPGPHWKLNDPPVAVGGTALSSVAGTASMPATAQAGVAGAASSLINSGTTGTVVGAYVFYKGSAFDTGGGSGHDAAIAPDKAPLLPGGTATFANYTSYDRGLNGIMVDISGTVTGLTAADFSFKTGNDNSPGGWAPVTAVATITVRPGAGVGGTTRVEITFDDGAIKNTWLAVTVLTGADTNLLNPVTFYFGNAVGESGNSALDARVDIMDSLTARGGLTAAAKVTNPLDFNRDGVVNNMDQAVVQGNITWYMNELRLITVPGAGPLFAVTFTSPYTSSQQGYATDGTYHYIFHTNAIFKKQNDASWTTMASNLSPFTGLTGTSHVGDGCYYNGYLYVPVEHWNGTSTDHIYLALYNASDLTYHSAVDVSAYITEASSVTVAADRGLIYVSNYIENKINIFSLADFSYKGAITLDIATTHWQGIAYKNGYLYIDSDSPQRLYKVNPDTGATKYVFDLTAVGVGESEGIDFSQTELRYFFNGVVYYLTPTGLL